MNMSISALILGESGTGKSTSLRNLDPAQTLLIQAIRKPLPFRSSDWKLVKEGGNIIVTDQAADIIKAMRKTTRQVIVIDDWQYILANEYMRRTDETGYQKFTDIGRKAWDILSAASDLDAGKRVYILAHTQSDEHGRSHIKTIGKMLDDKITPEGMFSIVLNTAVQNGNYLFATRNNGSNTTKSPLGLFDDELIDNDLAAVDAAIFTYYGLQEAA
jgi:hypothetical protein